MTSQRAGTVILILPLRTPLLTQNTGKGVHWSVMAKAKKDTELVMYSAIKKAKLKKIDGPIEVQLVWYAPDLGIRDTDNLAPMMKACTDALVKKGIIPDDNSKIVHRTILGPVVCARDNPRFEYWIRTVEGSGAVCERGPGVVVP